MIACAIALIIWAAVLTFVVRRKDQRRLAQEAQTLSEMAAGIKAEESLSHG